MKPNIGISEENRKAVTAILYSLVADEYVLSVKTRNYHWNITGPNFQELHKFFEGQYEALDEIIDDVSERVRALGHFAIGSLSDFLSLSQLKESKPEPLAAPIMLANLLNDHEIIIQFLRIAVNDTHEKYNDAGTSDFLTGLMEQHEKMAWMLRAYLF